MVQKSILLGKSSLIFVTVGTTQFSFDRLFSALDNVLITSRSKPLLIVQTGASKYKWRYKNIQIFPSLNPNEMNNHIKRASHIVTHGGFGSMFEIGRNSKHMPLIIARLQEYHEHVDDHQRFFLEYLINKVPRNYKKYFIYDQDLASSIANFLTTPSQKNILFPKIFNSTPSPTLLKNIEQSINSL